eukprot:TRINITY_DN16787_c1_g1_i1.p1 TRINITY_DN16787_c1_g1~~TRINITY_DN16787_c1_g1_i1.p1  ORF type:complete len:334 (+),score=52.16 TRINITY_DN16787_c1_g1_i1:123-1124(+)
MVRAPRPLGIALVLVAGTQVFYRASHLFVGAPRAAPQLRSASYVALRAEDAEAAEGEEGGEKELTEKEITIRDWGSVTPRRGIDLDSDRLSNLPLWYKEAIGEFGDFPTHRATRGGLPEGFMKDLLLRSFFGTFWESGYPRPSKAYTGPSGQPSEADYETALQNLRDNFKTGKNFVGRDDESEWYWLVAGQNPGGLFLYCTAGVPYGERPLAAIKRDNVDEFFDNVNWHLLFVRLHKWQLWGGQASRFPYPMARVNWGKFIWYIKYVKKPEFTENEMPVGETKDDFAMFTPGSWDKLNEERKAKRSLGQLRRQLRSMKAEKKRLLEKIEAQKA